MKYTIVAYLLKHAIEESLEAGAAEELAAVYELTRWLARQGYPYEIKCAAPVPFVLELLDIPVTSPSEASEAEYTFVLPRMLEMQMEQWLVLHWLTKRNTLPYNMLRLSFCE